jgi:hypothetical protein
MKPVHVRLQHEGPANIDARPQVSRITARSLRPVRSVLSRKVCLRSTLQSSLCSTPTLVSRNLVVSPKPRHSRPRLDCLQSAITLRAQTTCEVGLIVLRLFAGTVRRRPLYAACPLALSMQLACIANSSNPIDVPPAHCPPHFAQLLLPPRTLCADHANSYWALSRSKSNSIHSPIALAKLHS